MDAAATQNMKTKRNHPGDYTVIYKGTSWNIFRSDVGTHWHIARADDGCHDASNTLADAKDMIRGWVDGEAAW